MLLIIEMTIKIFIIEYNNFIINHKTCALSKSTSAGKDIQSYARHVQTFGLDCSSTNQPIRVIDISK